MARYSGRGYRRRGSGRRGSAVSKAVGAIFGGLLMLLVFDSLLDAIIPSLNDTVNESTGLCLPGENCWFLDTVTFIDSIIPVFGIIIVAVPIYMLFKKSIF